LKLGLSRKRKVVTLSLIKINELECKGCGICLDACPQGAIYLVDNVAGVDLERCDGCKICISECPNNAIRWINEKSEIIVPRNEAEIRKTHQPSSENYIISRKRTSILSTAIAAMAIIGREIVPGILNLIANRGGMTNQENNSSFQYYPKSNQYQKARSKYNQQRYRHRGRNF